MKNRYIFLSIFFFFIQCGKEVYSPYAVTLIRRTDCAPQRKYNITAFDANLVRTPGDVVTLEQFNEICGSALKDVARGTKDDSKDYFFGLRLENDGKGKGDSLVVDVRVELFLPGKIQRGGQTNVVLWRDSIIFLAGSLQ